MIKKKSRPTGRPGQGVEWCVRSDGPWSGGRRAHPLPPKGARQPTPIGKQIARLRGVCPMAAGTVSRHPRRRALRRKFTPTKSKRSNHHRRRDRHRLNASYVPVSHFKSADLKSVDRTRCRLNRCGSRAAGHRLHVEGEQNVDKAVVLTSNTGSPEIRQQRSPLWN